MGRQGAQCLDSADSTKVSLIYSMAGGEPWNIDERASKFPLKFSVPHVSTTKISLELDFNLNFSEGWRDFSQKLPCKKEKRRQRAQGWGTATLSFYIRLQRYNMSGFSCNAWPCNWMTASLSRHQLLLWQHKSPCRVVISDCSQIQTTTGLWECQKCRGIQAIAAKTKQRATDGEEGTTKQGTVAAVRSSAQKNVPGLGLRSVPRRVARQLGSIPLQPGFPASWSTTKHALTGALPLESTHFPVKMKVSRKLHLWFPRDFSLSLCFGSLRPLWYLSKAFPLAHLILITVYGNGNSVPPQGSNFERREGKQVQYDCLGEGHAVEYFNHFSVLWLWLFHADQQH